MDIAASLAAIAQAIGIVKELREIDKSFDVAVVKSQMADVYETLADVKIALAQARETIHERDATINQLQSQIESLSAGENCPKCNIGRLKLIESKKHPIFGESGFLERKYQCDHCGFTDEQTFDTLSKN